MTPPTAQQWIDHGFTTGTIGDYRAPVIWTDAGHTPASASRYVQRTGLPQPDAASWVIHDFDPDTVREWVTAGIEDPDDATRWTHAGVTPATVTDWVDNGFPSGWEWINAGIRTPQEATDWEQAGCTADLARGFTTRGWTAADAAAIRATGSATIPVACHNETHDVTVTWNNGRNRWRTLNHDPSLERTAEAFGVDPCPCRKTVAAAKQLVGVAYTPEDALAWAAHDQRSSVDGLRTLILLAHRDGAARYEWVFQPPPTV